MVDVFSGISAFNGMLGAAKALRDMDNRVSRNEAVIELQGQIFAAQENYATLTAKVGDLEKKLAAFETWESDKQRYELKEHGHNRVLAYALKEGVEPPEHPHSACPDCYEQRKRTILQTETYALGRAKALVCQTCDWRGFIEGHVSDASGRKR